MWSSPELGTVMVSEGTEGPRTNVIVKPAEAIDVVESDDFTVYAFTLADGTVQAFGVKKAG